MRVATRLFYTALMVNLLGQPQTSLAQARQAQDHVAQHPTEQWQTLGLGGHKMGYRHILRHPSENQLLTRETLVLTVSQPGAPNATSTTVLEYRESSTGQPLAITKRVTSATANHQMQATVDEQILVVSQLNSTNSPRKHAIPQPFYLPEGLRLALLGKTEHDSPFNYFSWNFSSQKFDHLQLQIQPYNSPDHPEARWQIRRHQLGDTKRSTLIVADQYFYFTEERSTSGGDEVIISDCSQTCAQADFEPATHVYRQLIASPYKITDTALRGKIRYRLQGLSTPPPSTFEQTVKPLTDGVEILVCDDCGAEAPPAPETLAVALQANYWLPSSEPVFKTVVDDILADKDITTAARMRRLSRFVSRHMNSEASYSGYATALEAYNSKQGDCTEHALLLATLARAAGIPSRVAFGMAYNNERFLGRKYVFVPHAWVQAWTGNRWQSFDSGLGKFTAGHITLGVSNGEQSEVLKLNEQLHQIKIISAVQIKSR
ncbi:transglutaminase-like domain-containing protein [Zhongshania guokunii]|uniref:Transglutaminase-like domain-containing protein n=1 Tax=Zhongshania guokunii TaxID=641783 RepID=A0ABV3U8M8_9GAMM